MTSRLGLISDPHATPGAVAHALSIFKQEKVDRILCTGDIAGYFDELDATIELLSTHKCECILGNHDQKFIEDNASQKNSRSYQYLTQLEQTLVLELEGKRIYMVHAEPPSEQHGGIKLLDLDGEIIPAHKTRWQQQLKDFNYDVLIVGHTHQVFAEHINNLLVINPGSSAFNHSCMILNLPDLSVQLFALENKDIIKCWNWGLFVRGH